jgi:hypothetical protein
MESPRVRLIIEDLRSVRPFEASSPTAVSSCCASLYTDSPYSIISSRAMFKVEFPIDLLDHTAKEAS